MNAPRLRDPVASKGPDAFRTISEVAEDLDLPQHVLRFWETRFAQIKPMKRGGGRRYYRPEDVDLLKGIRHLLYGEGFTIRGVQRLLKEKGSAFVVNAGQTGRVETVTAAEMDSAAANPVSAMHDPEDGLGGHSDPDLEEVSASPERLPHAAPRTPAQTPGQVGMSRETRSRLEGILAELSEAKRLLDHARSDNRSV